VLSVNYRLLVELSALQANVFTPNVSSAITAPKGLSVWHSIQNRTISALSEWNALENEPVENMLRKLTAKEWRKMAMRV
jgi:hypothetical protein